MKMETTILRAMVIRNWWRMNEFQSVKIKLVILILTEKQTNKLALVQIVWGELFLSLRFKSE